MSTLMKRNLWAVSLLALVFFSCKKDGSGTTSGSGTITCTLDGVNVSFNVNAKAMRMNAGAEQSVQITGMQASGNSNQIAMVVTGSSAITAGTYSENDQNGNVAGINYIEAGNTYPYVSYNSTTNPATITITAISSTSVQGSFKGDVYLMSSNGVTSTKKVVTNGQFKVNF